MKLIIIHIVSDIISLHLCIRSTTSKTKHFHCVKLFIENYLNDIQDIKKVFMLNLEFSLILINYHNNLAFVFYLFHSNCKTFCMPYDIRHFEKMDTFLV